MARSQRYMGSEVGCVSLSDSINDPGAVHGSAQPFSLEGSFVLRMVLLMVPRWLPGDTGCCSSLHIQWRKRISFLSGTRCKSFPLIWLRSLVCPLLEQLELPGESHWWLGLIIWYGMDVENQPQCLLQILLGLPTTITLHTQACKQTHSLPAPTFSPFHSVAFITSEEKDHCRNADKSFGVSSV